MFDVKAPQDPPKYEHIFGLNLIISYHITSLFDMYIDMAEMIAGEQDSPSLIIEYCICNPPQLRSFKPSHTGLTTMLRPCCDLKMLESWEYRTDCGLIARLVAEVVGDRG